MIVEIEEDSRDFTTIYRKNYLEKKTERPSKYKSLLNYPPPLNILNGPYKQYLNTRLENYSLPDNERSEDPMKYLDEIRNKFLHLKNVLPHMVPDENVIKDEKEKSRKTVYQLDYSKKFDKYSRSYLNNSERNIILQQNHIIPETIQKRSYRNPWMIATKNLIKPSKILKPINNLDPNIAERNILHISTGNSEYVETIGITGEKILQNFSIARECIESQKLLKSPETGLKCSLILKRNSALPSNYFDSSEL